MATIQRRADGGFYIRQFYQDHHTWQILGAGVRYLEFRGIKEGDSFSTSLFMELWQRGLVYHGERIPIAVEPARLDAASERALRERVSELHTVLHQGRVDDALSYAFEPAPDVTAFEAAALRCQGVPWRVADLVVYPMGAESQAEFRGAVQFAKVAVKIGAKAMVLTEYWLHVDGQWRLAAF